MRHTLVIEIMDTRSEALFAALDVAAAFGVTLRDISNSTDHLPHSVVRWSRRETSPHPSLIPNVIQTICYLIKEKTSA